MASFLFALCLSAPLALPQEPRATEFYSLRHLVTPLPPPTPPPWGTLLRRPTNNTRVDLIGNGDSNEVAPFHAEQLLDVLRELAAPALESGRLELQLVDRSLLASGDPAAVRAVGDKLRAATPVLARPLQVEFAVWDGADRETPATVLGPAEFQRFAGNRAPLWRSVATTQQGIAVALERMRWSDYVHDIDVEVAQKQTISHPVNDDYGDGCHAVVRPFALLGNDEFAVQVQFAVAQRRGVVRSVATGMPNAAEIELPTLETAYGACSARIHNGGALAATLRGHAGSGGAHIVTVRVIARAPAGNGMQQDLAILPCGAIAGAQLTQRMRPFEDFDAAPEGEPEPDPLFAPDQLVQYLREGLGSAAENTALLCSRSWLVARGEASALAKVETMLRTLQDRLVRNVTLQHTGTLQPADGEAGAPPPTLHGLSLPTLAGQQLTIARCLESPILAEVWCEIAAEAAILDPKVELMQSGLFLRACPSLVDDAMHLQLSLLHRHATVPQTRAVMPGGILMPTEIARTTASHDGIVGNGQTVDHGDGPILVSEGRAFRSVLATVLRW